MRPIVTALAASLLAGGLAFVSAPASAAGDPRCTDLPQQVRAALASAEPATAAKAARRLRTGEALCRARNQRDAAREFEVALKLLGTPVKVAAAGK